MKLIPLSQGKFTIVDDEDYERLISMGKWSYGNGYAVRVSNVIKDDGSKKSISINMSQVVIQSKKGVIVDHINRDRLDNRKCNLRVCTRTENNRNVGKKSTSAGRFKGVFWNKKAKIWYVRIGVNGKSKYIGCFKDDIEAARAYNEAAIKYHGEFANLNPI